jgi:hypothetical protein
LVPQFCQGRLNPSLARLGLFRPFYSEHVLPLAAGRQVVVGGTGGRIGVEGAREVCGLGHGTGLGIELHVDLDLVATSAACRLAVLRPSRQRPRMMATRLFQECPLIMMVTAGRLPPPSAATTSGGISKPLMGSTGST